MVRWAFAFIAVGAIAFVALMVQQYQFARGFTVLDEPLHVVAGRTVTDAFSLAANTPYEANIYVQERVPYADCFLGQASEVNERCAQHPRVIDVAWELRGKNGELLHDGMSGGTCCSYTTGEHNNAVVYASLASFGVERATEAYLQFKYKRKPAGVLSLEPRIVVERTEDPEYAGVMELFGYLVIGAMAIIGVVLLIIAGVISRRRAGSH